MTVCCVLCVRLRCYLSNQRHSNHVFIKTIHKLIWMRAVSSISFFIHMKTILFEHSNENGTYLLLLLLLFLGKIMLLSLESYIYIYIRSQCEQYFPANFPIAHIIFAILGCRESGTRGLIHGFSSSHLMLFEKFGEHCESVFLLVCASLYWGWNVDGGYGGDGNTNRKRFFQLIIDRGKVSYT